jgi:YD repeat-containing protein
MKKVLFSILTVAALLIGMTGTVFAAGPVEYTIDVRNRTGQSVELNYTGADQVIHQVSIAKGVSSLTIPEGVYSYWASLKCGNIAGSINLSQQAQILWLTCDSAAPSVKTTGPKEVASLRYLSCYNGPGQYEVPLYDWGQYDSNGDVIDWGSFGSFCFDILPDEGDNFWTDLWSSLNNDVDSDGNFTMYYYEYRGEGGIDGTSPYGGNCPGWSEPGPGFYYYGFDVNTGPFLDCD